MTAAVHGGLSRWANGIAIGNTPMCPIELRLANRRLPVLLKLESENPMGSLKDRTAASLLADLETRGLLNESSVLIESTSGNLGVALAFLCRERGYRFLAVIDPKTTPEVCARLQEFGADLELVEEMDETGGYLRSRLRALHQLCERSNKYVWSNQYGNLANPRAHYLSTAPEIYQQTGGRADAVFVAVSTGGTLAGVGKYFREVSPATKIIGVDAAGSVIFGTPPGKRRLTGIGSSLTSGFLTPDLYDGYVIVTDQQAFSMCRQMASLGIQLGGSSGAVLYACAQYAMDHPELEKAVCLCPDGGKNYLSTIFSDDWMRENGFCTDPTIAFIEEVCRAGMNTGVLLHQAGR